MSSEKKKKTLSMAAREQLMRDTCRFTLFDDVFMNAVFQNIEACQYVIRVITGMPNIKIVDSRPQHNLKCIATRSAILDVLAQDSDGTLYNIEFQKADTRNHARRVRFYGALVDSSYTPKGADFNDVPNLICIYLSETDIWGYGRSIYCVKKFFEGTEVEYDDGLEIIYVNAAIDDSSEISRLMQYFKSADPTNSDHAALSARVRYLKTDKGGLSDMCEITQKYCDAVIFEEKIGILRNLLKMGIAEDKACDCAEIPEAQREEALALAKESMTDTEN